MAYKITAICDRCKKEETQDSQWFSEGKNGWQEVKFEIAQYQYKKYLFCPECRKQLGLIKESPASVVKVETVADRLFDCIAEIVAGQMQT